MAKGTLTVRVLGDTRSFAKSMDSVAGGMRDLGRKVALASAAVAAGGAAIGAKVLTMGAAFEDLDRKASTVFEDQLGSAEKWAKAQAGAMGLTSRELLGLTASFADLLKPMGFTAEQATGMAKDTNQLAGALSKWSGGQRTAAEASAILAKAMLGEREGLKELGISILESDVQRRVAANGADHLTGAALEQARAIATQQLIMEKSVDAQKAWADGQGDLSVKINEVKAKVLEFRDQAVATLLPHVVNIAEKFLEWGAVVAERLKPILEDLKAWWDENGPQVVAKVTEVAEAVRDALAGAFELLRTAFAFVIEHAETFIPLAQGVLSAVLAWKVMVTVIQAITAAQAIWNAVMAANPIGLVVVAIAALVGALVTAYQTSEGFRKAWDFLWSMATAVIGEAVGKIVALFQAIWDAWFAIHQRITGFVADAAAWLYDAGRDLIQGFIDGIKDMAGAAVDAVKGVGTGVVDGVKGILGISSPSKVFAGLGKDTIAGFIGGLEDAESGLKATVQKIFSGVVSGASGVLQGIGSLLARGDSQAAVANAQSELDALLGRNASLPAEIAAAQKELEELRAASTAITADELRAEMDAINALNDAQGRFVQTQWDEKASKDELRLAGLELEEAEQNLADVRAAMVAPSSDVIDAEERLKELLAERDGMLVAIEEAERAVVDAKLAAVEAEVRLFEAGQDANGVTSEQIGLLLELGAQAGVSASELQPMIDQYLGLGQAAREANAAISAALPRQVSQPKASPGPIPDINLGRVALPGVTTTSSSSFGPDAVNRLARQGQGVTVNVNAKVVKNDREFQDILTSALVEARRSNPSVAGAI